MNGALDITLIIADDLPGITRIIEDDTALLSSLEPIK